MPTPTLAPACNDRPAGQMRWGRDHGSDNEESESLLHQQTGHLIHEGKATSCSPKPSLPVCVEEPAAPRGSPTWTLRPRSLQESSRAAGQSPSFSLTPPPSLLPGAPAGLPRQTTTSRSLPQPHTRPWPPGAPSLMVEAAQPGRHGQASWRRWHHGKNSHPLMFQPGPSLAPPPSMQGPELL